MQKLECRFLKQAINNERFLLETQKNNPSDFHDWKVTIAFYAAVHYFKSFAKTQGINLVNHKDTFNKMYSQANKPSELRIDSQVVWYYRTLFNLAHTSRYHGYTKDDVNESKRCNRVFGDN